MKQAFQKLLTWSIVLLLIGVGGYATYLVLKPVEQPKRAYTSVTRSAVDSTVVSQYKVYAGDPVKTKEPIKWNEITTAIVSITIALGTVRFKAEKDKMYGKIDDIYTILDSVVDQKERDTIDKMLLKIEQDAAGFVDDNKAKALIEGIGSRTRLFCRDVMIKDFTGDSLDNALMKMEARANDSRQQIKELEYCGTITKRIDVIREHNLDILKQELKNLYNDHIHNAKYQRFGEIICRFQRNYMKAIVKLTMENQA